MFASTRIKEASWTFVFSTMSFWVSLLTKKATSAIILLLDVYMSLWMLPSLRMRCSSLIHPSMYVFQGEIIHDQALLDNLEVSTSISTAENSYILPHRRNRGVPPYCYSLKGKARYAIAHYVSDHRLSLECKAFVTKMDSIKIPTHVEDVFSDPKWAEAMNIEMEALQKNNTWDIVDLPKGTKPMRYRWLVTMKYNADGTVERYKSFAILSSKPRLDHKVPTNKERYQRLVGQLIYLSLTRPSIAYTSAPGRDYAGNIIDRRSTSGYFIFVGSNLVTWPTKKQNIVSRSSAESEYRGIAKGSAFEIANNHVQHGRTKHVEVDGHFIKEKMKHELSSAYFVESWMAFVS
ncbi:unnamed protein product [Prunus armeniaca]